MNANKIEELLNRYYDGLTSEDEERELKSFFAEQDAPEHLQREREIFLQLQAETDVPEGLEEWLSQSIDEWEAKERQALPMRKRNRILRLQWISGIAASVLILFSVGMWIDRPSEPKDTCTTPEEAYVHAQYALAMLSSTFNKGMDKMVAVQITTENISNTVNKHFNSIK